MKRLSPKRRDSSSPKKDVMALAKASFFTKETPKSQRQPNIRLGADIQLVSATDITTFVDKLINIIEQLIKNYPQEGIQNNYLSLLQTEISEILPENSPTQLSNKATHQTNKVNCPIIMHRLSTWLKALEQYSVKLAEQISETSDDKTKKTLIQVQKELLILFRSMKPIYDAYWHAEKQNAKNTSSLASSTEHLPSYLEEPVAANSSWSPARSSSSDSISPRTSTGRISPGSHRTAYQSKLYAPSESQMNKYFSANGDADIRGLNETEEKYQKQFKSNLNSYVQDLLSQEQVSSPRPKR